ncbi:hypothetical protein RRG08_057796 [Elysia crispata]|uniref:Uncharacterized protein n=1 Tax=Elysia crispata TaxID=231223 RepID=A0AAE0Z4X2_9GAST|nr:hypothetical protein RRG08_057796 [Elysia crispata]
MRAGRAVVACGRGSVDVHLQTCPRSFCPAVSTHGDRPVATLGVRTTQNQHSGTVTCLQLAVRHAHCAVISVQSLLTVKC